MRLGAAGISTVRPVSSIKLRVSCALAGSVAEGVAVSMDIEQLLYEAGRLQDAASLLNRISHD